MSAKDEEWQEAAEQGRRIDPDNIDEKAYSEVFRVLKMDPGYTPRAGFAERVAASVVARKAARNYRDYLWFGAGILVLLAASIGTVLYSGLSLNLKGFSIDLGFLSGMAHYKGLAIFGVIFVALLNWLDKRLVRHGTGSV